MNHCQQCDYCWIPRTDERSKVCPRCHSRNWDGTLIGRDQYNFTSIEVGQSRLYEWPEQKRHRLSMALRTFAWRTKRKFLMYPSPKGLEVKRIY